MPYSKSTQKDYGDNPLQKKSGFKMKYQGNNSAFPFKQSPAKQFAGVVAQQNATRYQHDAPDNRPLNEEQARVVNKTQF